MIWIFYKYFSIISRFTTNLIFSYDWNMFFVNSIFGQTPLATFSISIFFGYMICCYRMLSYSRPWDNYMVTQFIVPIFICGRRYINDLVRPSVRPSHPFDPLNCVRISRNLVSVCISMKEASGHRSRVDIFTFHQNRGQNPPKMGRFSWFLDVERQISKMGRGNLMKLSHNV